MVHQPGFDPYDWRTIEPHYSALLREPLAPEQVPGWLARWSDLERVMSETLAAAFRAKNEDTSYRWHELKRFDYTPEVTHVLHAAIEKEIVPVALWQAERRRT